MFVIVDVGCLECGEETKVLGCFYTLDAAKRRFQELFPESYNAIWDYMGIGQRQVRIYETAPEYYRDLKEFP